MVPFPDRCPEAGTKRGNVVHQQVLRWLRSRVQVTSLMSLVNNVMMAQQL
jgi:hypothetical protein